MHSLLPDAKELRVNQQLGRITARSCEALDQLLLILPERRRKSVWTALPQGKRLEAVMRRRKPGSVVQARLGNKRQTRVIIGTIKPDATAFEQLVLGRKLVSAATAEKSGAVGICAAGFDDSLHPVLVSRALAAALAAGFALPSFKSDSKDGAKAAIRSVRLLGLEEKLDTSRIEAEAAGNNLARWLTTLPPNKLDAVQYAELARDLASAHGWAFRQFKTRDLEKLGAGAFLAVAQGNQDDSASIVRLRYRPGQKKTADVSLVGKGIIFDTGGTNLKPFSSMLDMHGDMQGSAVALGTLLAISKLRLPIAVDCWLSLTENRTGPTAYKSQDVVTALNGKTIQTIHTDAEGRMALADTLVLASREKPRVIIDYATLTGTCISALTTRYSGVFTNRPSWHPILKRRGQRCGERVWPFPIGSEFLEDLESPIADIKQCSPDGAGDHILAASFLNEFVEDDTPWIHLDLAAGKRKGGLGPILTDVTGFGVHFSMGLILDDELHEAATQ